MASAGMLARHYSRIVTQRGRTFGEDGKLPPDQLSSSGLDLQPCGGTGFPATADAVAFEPVQSLLAVATSDGRVKLIGRPGVEATLRAGSRAPTRHLCFLRNRGALLRVDANVSRWGAFWLLWSASMHAWLSQGNQGCFSSRESHRDHASFMLSLWLQGELQLFGLERRRLAASTLLRGDAINAAALLPDDPYLLLGCESGSVRVVGLLGPEGQPAEGATPAVDLELLPYQVGVGWRLGWVWVGLDGGCRAGAWCAGFPAGSSGAGGYFASLCRSLTLGASPPAPWPGAGGGPGRPRGRGSPGHHLLPRSPAAGASAPPQWRGGVGCAGGTCAVRRAG